VAHLAWQNGASAIEGQCFMKPIRIKPGFLQVS